MRFLFITTVGSTMFFFRDLIEELTSQGHTVDLAANETLKPLPASYDGYSGRFFHISCTRQPLHPDNLTAMRQIKKIVRDNRYDVVHCHTPIAGACARLACRSLRKQGLRVIYTSHGFHFFKGAPKKNWLVYYPIEKHCSRFTDTLITINHEDFAIAQKRLKAKRTEYVPGVGLDIEKFADAPADREGLRKAFGIPEDAFLLISVGELNQNKNQQIVIKALAQLQDSRIHYLVVGKGPLQQQLQELAQSLQLSDQVHFAGFRTDVERLYKIADAEVFPSRREGLGLVAVEGMAAGLPVICADNRGTREYTADFREKGFPCVCAAQQDFCDSIRRVADDGSLRAEMVAVGRLVAQRFSVKTVNRRMMQLYGLLPAPDTK